MKLFFTIFGAIVTGTIAVALIFKGYSSWEAQREKDAEADGVYSRTLLLSLPAVKDAPEMQRAFDKAEQALEDSGYHDKAFGLENQLRARGCRPLWSPTVVKAAVPEVKRRQPSDQGRGRAFEEQQAVMRSYEQELADNRKNWKPTLQDFRSLHSICIVMPASHERDLVEQFFKERVPSVLIAEGPRPCVGSVDALVGMEIGQPPSLVQVYDWTIWPRDDRHEIRFSLRDPHDLHIIWETHNPTRTRGGTPEEFARWALQPLNRDGEWESIHGSQ